MSKSLEIKPIATVIGGRTEPTDDHWTGTAIIRLNPDFPAEVVQGLEEFSHLLVVWHFHKASPTTSPCTPAAPATTPNGQPPAPSSTATTAGPTSSPSPSPDCSRSTAWTSTSPTLTPSTEARSTTSPRTSGRWAHAARSASLLGQARCSRTTGTPHRAEAPPRSTDEAISAGFSGVGRDLPPDQGGATGPVRRGQALTSASSPLCGPARRGPGHWGRAAGRVGGCAR